MSRQALRRGRPVHTVRRRWILVAALAILGLIGGGAFAASRTPTFTSETLVVLPKAAPSIGTEVLIANSQPVLTRALSNLSPHISLEQLQTVVEAQSITPYIISITAEGTTAAQAEATANAVARSYIAYVSSPGNPGGQVSASVLQSASSAAGTSFRKQLVIDALAGALAGLLIGAVAVLVFGRADRRLTKRSEIAKSVGAPVLAAVPVAHPANAEGWAKLLENYDPGVMHGRQLRQSLQQLGITVIDSANDSSEPRRYSLTILSLTSDPGAFALGPQLAVFTASLGIPTVLAIGPQQDVAAMTALREAGAVSSPASSKRLDSLRVVDSSEADGLPDTGLTVVVAVVDSQKPQLADLRHTTATVMGVSAGATTAEQLARVVSSALIGSREIAGVFLADPDPADPTTGRLSRPTQQGHRRAAAPVRRIVTEIRR